MDFGGNPEKIHGFWPLGPAGVGGWVGLGGTVGRSIWLRFRNHYTVWKGLGESCPNLALE